MAKPTLSAWKLLSTYLVISATPIGDPEARARQTLVEVHHLAAGTLVALADHGLGRIEEVLDAGALAQELGVHAHAEVDARLLAGGLFEDRGTSRSSHVPGSIVLR